jgi:redox-sensitive bicupin YhaK (pirin superfamily)
MIRLRPSDERGHFDHGWLDTFHSFSFAMYHDLDHMGFRDLRVMNEDRVHPGRGFGTHPHQDMEILTYVLEGALEHRDSLGNGTVIEAGELQRMTAGTGIQHSEFNASKTDPVHFYQIWILPERKGLEPGYEQRRIDAASENGLQLVASRTARDGSLTIHQDADVYRAFLTEGGETALSLRPTRHAWVQVVRGSVELNGHSLGPGDGAAVSEEDRLELVGQTEAEALVFDLA